jgi:hypothetical protein
MSFQVKVDYRLPWPLEDDDLIEYYSGDHASFRTRKEAEEVFNDLVLVAEEQDFAFVRLYHITFHKWEQVQRWNNPKGIWIK